MPPTVAGPRLGALRFGVPFGGGTVVVAVMLVGRFSPFQV